jgi:hypothetical protein
VRCPARAPARTRRHQDPRKGQGERAGGPAGGGEERHALACQRAKRALFTRWFHRKACAQAASASYASCRSGSIYIKDIYPHKLAGYITAPY